MSPFTTKLKDKKTTICLKKIKPIFKTLGFSITTMQKKKIIIPLLFYLFVDYYCYIIHYHTLISAKLNKISINNKNSTFLTSFLT